MKLCPFCGVELIENIYGDLVCPNHGIVKYHKDESDETPSYIG